MPVVHPFSWYQETDSVLKINKVSSEGGNYFKNMKRNCFTFSRLCMGKEIVIVVEVKEIYFNRIVN